MRRIKSFTFLSLNGYYKGLDEDTSWHSHTNEAAAFSEKQLASNDTLLFGRKTYEMMHSFWPTKNAFNLYPIVAKRMNEAKKLVASAQLKSVNWENTSLLNGDVIEKLNILKQSDGPNITILGSGTIVTLLTNNELIDEYQILLDPLVLKNGSSFLNGLTVQVNLKLVDCVVFKKSGQVLLHYSKK